MSVDAAAGRRRRQTPQSLIGRMLCAGWPGRIAGYRAAHVEDSKASSSGTYGDLRQPAGFPIVGVGHANLGGENDRIERPLALRTRHRQSMSLSAGNRSHTKRSRQTYQQSQHADRAPTATRSPEIGPIVGAAWRAIHTGEVEVGVLRLLQHGVPGQQDGQEEQHGEEGVAAEDVVDCQT